MVGRPVVLWEIIGPHQAVARASSGPDVGARPPAFDLDVVLQKWSIPVPVGSRWVSAPGPTADAWVVAPSNGFNRIGESTHRSYGPGLGARVVLPKHLLKATLSKRGTDYEHLLRDNYETPYYTPELGGNEFEL